MHQTDLLQILYSYPKGSLRDVAGWVLGWSLFSSSRNLYPLPSGLPAFHFSHFPCLQSVLIPFFCVHPCAILFFHSRLLFFPAVMQVLFHQDFVRQEVIHFH